MDIPSQAQAETLLGPACVLVPAGHWIAGRGGLVYRVTRREDGRRSIFKWCSPEELVCCRDLLPSAPMPTPRLYRWWPASSGLPPAVELEFIPTLALPDPCYRFSPDHLPLTDPAWRGERLEILVRQLGRMHAVYWEGKGLGTHRQVLSRATPEEDLAYWRENMVKLAALPGEEAAAWAECWAAREQHFERLLAQLYGLPLSWCWGDAKWDHLGCRSDGTVVVLEWAGGLRPPGSDLYLVLFEAPARRQQLLASYLGELSRVRARQEAERVLVLGLARACFIHGPGQACLSLRGVAGGRSSAEDRQAWAADALVSARGAEVLAGDEGLAGLRRLAQS